MTSMLISLLFCIMAFSACTEQKQNRVIGVSQCSEDIWRSWQNSEMKMEANFHEGVELRFAAALDDSERQIQQIDSLVDSGINLLIVAPNQLSSVSPAIDRAYDKGIPVIVFITDPDTAPSMRGNIEEVKSRGAKVYTIATKSLSKPEDTIMVEDYAYYLSSVAVSSIAFYLAYYVALAKGLNVDKPRNLAKSVTVE